MPTIEPMFSKTDATTISNAYKATVRDRVIAFLKARAIAGFVGGTFTWTDADDNAVLAAVRLELIAAPPAGGGWTIALDVPNKTATIS